MDEIWGHWFVPSPFFPAHSSVVGVAFFWHRACASSEVGFALTPLQPITSCPLLAELCLITALCCSAVVPSSVVHLPSDFYGSGATVPPVYMAIGQCLAGIQGGN